MKLKRLAVLVTLAVAALSLWACAPSADPLAGSGPDPAGFWQGLWNGFTTLFTFIISLFNDSVGIYEVNNNGGWYNFGYVLGVMMFFGGGGGGAAGSRRR